MKLPRENCCFLQFSRHNGWNVINYEFITFPLILLPTFTCLSLSSGFFCCCGSHFVCETFQKPVLSLLRLFMSVRTWAETRLLACKAFGWQVFNPPEGHHHFYKRYLLICSQSVFLLWTFMLLCIFLKAICFISLLKWITNKLKTERHNLHEYSNPCAFEFQI